MARRTPGKKRAAPAQKNRTATRPTASTTATTAVPAPPLGAFGVWFLAARPKTLPAALGPIVLGTSLAIRGGEFAFGPALAATLCAILLQIGSNYANDYFDHRHGADSADRRGPQRATANGWVTPTQMRNATVLVLGLATLLGLYLVYVGGWPILVAGVAALIATLAYTGGPFPYGYRGLGDLFVFIFFGLVAVNGAYYLQTGEISALSILAGVCAGALNTAILVVNNLRDLETDRRAGKRTLAVIFGKRGAQIEYLVLILVAYLGGVLIWQMAGGSFLLLLPIVSMPLALRHIQDIWSYTEAARADLNSDLKTDLKSDLNDTLAGTARVSLFFSLLLSAGLLLQ